MFTFSGYVDNKEDTVPFLWKTELPHFKITFCEFFFFSGRWSDLWDRRLWTAGIQGPVRKLCSVHAVWARHGVVQGNCGVRETVICLCFFIYIYLLICLAASGLGCGMRDLLLQCENSVVVVHRFSCSEACGILVSWPGIEHGSPELQDGFSTTGSPGKSHVCVFFKCILISWILSVDDWWWFPPLAKCCTIPSSIHSIHVSHWDRRSRFW